MARIKTPLYHKIVSAGFAAAMVTLSGCATYPGLTGSTAQGTGNGAALEQTAAAGEPERASAVAEIRARADAAAAENTSGSPGVFNSYGPSGETLMTRAERLAVEAELEAVLAAQAQAANPAEAERLKARAAYLKRLAGQHGMQAEADIQAASQAAN